MRFPTFPIISAIHNSSIFQTFVIPREQTILTALECGFLPYCVWVKRGPNYQCHLPRRVFQVIVIRDTQYHAKNIVTIIPCVPKILYAGELIVSPIDSIDVDAIADNEHNTGLN